jgi:hypothetical protein
MVITRRVRIDLSQAGEARQRLQPVGPAEGSRQPQSGPPAGAGALAVQVRVLQTARALDYCGYSKHDALNAPWMERLAGNSRLRRLGFIQLVMRAPLHVRPWLGVRTMRNPKGLALFARALLARYRTTGDVSAAVEARALADWLIAHPSPAFGYAWGYPYPWQDVGFFAPRDFPNRVVTCFVTEALVDAYQTLGDTRYLSAAEKATSFLLTAPRTLYEDDDRRCVSYVPSADVNWIVMDVSALTGAVAARVAAIRGDAAMMAEAGRLVRYVVSRQTPEGAWFYTDPPSASHITHDNYHTGFILDAVLEYGRASGSHEFADAYQRGLVFYRERLFEADGAPRFMSDQKYPFDIHGAAQGIVTFARSHAAYGDGGLVAEKVLRWTLANMYDESSGWFYYQKRRLVRTAIRELRWCQAWMAFALGCYAEHVERGR